VNPAQCQSHEWACSRVLLCFYERFDRWDYEGMAALFTPDGAWHRAGKLLQGRAAIVAELQKRSTTQKIRHVVTNLLVDVHDETHAEARCYLTVYRQDSGTATSAPAMIRSPSLVLVVTASLVGGVAGWRIARQTMQREFEFAQP